MQYFTGYRFSKYILATFCLVIFALFIRSRNYHILGDARVEASLPGFCARCLPNLKDEPAQKCDLIDNNPSTWLHPLDVSDMPFWFFPVSQYAANLPVLKVGHHSDFQLLPPQNSISTGDGALYFRYLGNTDLSKYGLLNFTDYWRLDFKSTVFDNVANFGRPSGNTVEELEKMWYAGEKDAFLSGRNSWMRLDALQLVKQESHYKQISSSIVDGWKSLTKVAADSMSDLSSVEEVIHYSYGKSYIQTHLRPLLEKYAEYVKGKTGVILGSTYPWLEYEALRVGAGHVTTVEYLNLSTCFPKDHPRMSYYHPNEMERLVASGELWKDHEQFDFGMSFSSLEHPGLGRYSDPLNPDADLMEMTKMSCLIKPGGLVFVGVPSKDDSIFFNLHRYYGHKRYALLMECFRPVEYESLKSDSGSDELYQPWLVFQNLRGCLL